MSPDQAAPWGRCRIASPSAQPMYSAAQRWRDESLIDDLCLFDGRHIDGGRAAAELVEFYVNNPDVGSGSFGSKLAQQLAPASDDAVQVAAELLYVHALIATTTRWSARSKADLVRTVTGFREQGVTPMPADLVTVLSGGAAGTGQAYLNLRWKMFAYLIEIFRTIKQLSRPARLEAVSSLGAFREAVRHVDTQSVWSQQYALEHLLFPDVAPVILSRADRDAIAQAFPEVGPDILTVGAGLEPNLSYGDRAFVDPYLHPYRARWNPSQAERVYGAWGREIAGVADLDREERAYKIERGSRIRKALQLAATGDDPQAALVSALRGFNVVDFRVADTFLTWAAEHPESTIAALRELQSRPGPESIDRFLSHVEWDHLPGMGARLSIASTLLLGCQPEHLPPWRETAARVTQRLTDGYGTEAAATAGEIYMFFLARLDAIAAAVNHRSDNTADDGADDDSPAQLVLQDRLDAQGLAWTIAGSDVVPADWSAETREAFQSWRGGKPTTVPVPHADTPPTPEPEVPKPLAPETVSFEQLVDDLHLDEQGSAWMIETIALVQRKQQLILQGPPGTGKTFLARALARFLAGTADRVTTVQFHPGTSYEDFVQGLRPNPLDPAKFVVVDGPLITVARQAADDPHGTYVLLVDEINRGNVPAIFGELYFLLEYRDEPVTLLYGQTMALPPNLLIIGTMNTADRSITTLDAALRRRFYVRDLRPGEAPVDGVLRRYLTKHAPGLQWLNDLLSAANRAIGDPDQYIGPSHFMGEVDEDWARRAWSYSVMPTLRELYYNDPGRAEALDFDLLREQITRSEPGPSPTSNADT